MWLSARIGAHGRSPRMVPFDIDVSQLDVTVLRPGSTADLSLPTQEI